jgi:hypothetical protein
MAETTAVDLSSLLTGNPLDVPADWEYWRGFS